MSSSDSSDSSFFSSFFSSAEEKKKQQTSEWSALTLHHKFSRYKFWCSQLPCLLVLEPTSHSLPATKYTEHIQTTLLLGCALHHQVSFVLSSKQDQSKGR